MNNNKGELLHKSVYKRPKVLYILTMPGGLFMISLSLILLISSIIEIITLMTWTITAFYYLFESMFLIIMGLVLLMLTFSYLVNYLKIFDNGILIRKWGILSFIKLKYISFDEIYDVEISKSHSSQTQWLIIYVQDQLPHVLNTDWITMRNKAVKLIQDNMKAKGDKSKFLFFTRRIYGKTRFIEYLIPVKCSGSGLVNDPLIIEENHYIPKRPHIYNYTSLILIENLKLKELHLYECKHLVVKSMDLKRCSFSHCSTLKIEDLIISKKTKLDYCIKSKLYQNNLNKLELNKCHDNHFKESVISRLKETASKTNTYEKCKIE